jgi:hypothetical protein
MCSVPRKPPFSEADARAAIARSSCWADALRALGYEMKGANSRTLEKWAGRWNVSTDHFAIRTSAESGWQGAGDPLGGRPCRGVDVQPVQPQASLGGVRLAGVSVRDVRARRVLARSSHVADSGSRQRCLENLRMVCPNCAATLDTHCGRNLPRERTCPGCGQPFVPRTIRHRHCSEKCWGVVAAAALRGVPQPARRKVERPSNDQLVADVNAGSFVAVGRKYGVSDNAVRKWIRWYEYEREMEE